jgi:hypothetical protein
LASAETDVLRRWIATYPVRQGGGLFIFTGPEARQQEIANSLELNSITGYNITTCGTSVLVWISGFDCDGQELELTQRIQQETMMNLLESHCFLTDEINYRLATDCAQGTFPAEYCP